MSSYFFHGRKRNREKLCVFEKTFLLEEPDLTSALLSQSSQSETQTLLFTHFHAQGRVMM